MKPNIKIYYNFVRPDLINIPDYKVVGKEFPFPTTTIKSRKTAILIKYLTGHVFMHSESYTRPGDITFMFEFNDGRGTGI